MGNVFVDQREDLKKRLKTLFKQKFDRAIQCNPIDLDPLLQIEVHSAPTYYEPMCCVGGRGALSDFSILPYNLIILQKTSQKAIDNRSRRIVSTIVWAICIMRWGLCVRSWSEASLNFPCMMRGTVESTQVCGALQFLSPAATPRSSIVTYARRYIAL